MTGVVKTIIRANHMRACNIVRLCLRENKDLSYMRPYGGKQSWLPTRGTPSTSERDIRVVGGLRQQ